MTSWIKIDPERPGRCRPDENQPCLVVSTHDPKRKQHCAYFAKGDFWGANIKWRITHWQPLPAPPEDV